MAPTIKTQSMPTAACVAKTPVMVYSRMDRNLWYLTGSALDDLFDQVNRAPLITVARMISARKGDDC